MNIISTRLNEKINGVAYSTPTVLEKYSIDRSILKVHPRTVVIPESAHDIANLVTIANHLAVKGISFPITVRGNGSDKTGAAIGSGMIVSMEKLNKIFELDNRSRLIRVQAGATLGSLNTVLGRYGFRLPIEADPNHTIGGLIANACGSPSPHSNNSILNYLEQAEVILSTGDTVSISHLKHRELKHKLQKNSFEGEIYRRTIKLLDDFGATVQPSSSERINLSGYPGLRLLRPTPKTINLLPAFWASQGTLGVIAEVILGFSVQPSPSRYIAAIYPDVESALSLITALPELNFRRADIYDIHILHNAGCSGKVYPIFEELPESGYLILLATEEVYHWRDRKNRKLAETLLKHASQVSFSDPSNYKLFKEISLILSTYLNNSSPELRPPLVDDVYIPKESLLDYSQGLSELGKKYDSHFSLFGSLLDENYSVRPEFNLGTVPGRQFAMSFLREYSNLVANCGGTLAGGSPEGRLKAICTNPLMEAHEAQLYAAFKDIMDPDNIFNPGVKQQATLQSVVRQFRTSYNSGHILR